MNLPFPPVLRPQRAVDIIISFDFTARMTDYGDEPEFDPLKQVRLAEKWARIHKLDFPRVPGKALQKCSPSPKTDVFLYPINSRNCVSF